ncbi:hypothetical protein JCM3765_002017 [Sporobolomyces pararoseus]
MTSITFEDIKKANKMPESTIFEGTSWLILGPPDGIPAPQLERILIKHGGEVKDEYDAEVTHVTVAEPFWDKSEYREDVTFEAIVKANEDEDSAASGKERVWMLKSQFVLESIKRKHLLNERDYDQFLIKLKEEEMKRTKKEEDDDFVEFEQEQEVESKPSISESLEDDNKGFIPRPIANSSGIKLENKEGEGSAAKTSIAKANSKGKRPRTIMDWMIKNEDTDEAQEEEAQKPQTKEANQKKEAVIVIDSDDEPIPMPAKKSSNISSSATTSHQGVHRSEDTSMDGSGSSDLEIIQPTTSSKSKSKSTWSSPAATESSSRPKQSTSTHHGSDDYEDDGLGDVDMDSHEIQAALGTVSDSDSDSDADSDSDEPIGPRHRALKAKAHSESTVGGEDFMEAEELGYKVGGGKRKSAINKKKRVIVLDDDDEDE